MVKKYIESKSRIVFYDRKYPIIYYNYTEFESRIALCARTPPIPYKYNINI